MLFALSTLDIIDGLDASQNEGLLLLTAYNWVYKCGTWSTPGMSNPDQTPSPSELFAFSLLHLTVSDGLSRVSGPLFDKN